MIVSIDFYTTGVACLLYFFGKKTAMKSRQISFFFQIIVYLWYFLISSCYFFGQVIFKKLAGACKFLYNRTFLDFLLTLGKNVKCRRLLLLVPVGVNPCIVIIFFVLQTTLQAALQTMLQYRLESIKVLYFSWNLQVLLLRTKVAGFFSLQLPAKLTPPPPNLTKISKFGFFAKIGRKGLCHIIIIENLLCRTFIILK